MHNTGELSKLALAVITTEAGMLNNKKSLKHFAIEPRKKIACFRLSGFQKKSHPGDRKKNFFSYFFGNMIVLFYSSFYLDSIYTTFI